MAEAPEVIPIHPVASRILKGRKKPHVGPHYHAYKQAHEETVGHESDAWWAKVSAIIIACRAIADELHRPLEIPFTGIDHSALLDPEDSRQAISLGSQKGG